MGIDSPSTYGEHYWKNSVEAAEFFDEKKEDALSPYFAGLIGDIPDIGELPDSVQSFMNVLREPHSAGLGGLLQLTGAEFAAEILKDSLAPAMSMLKRATNRRAKETWLTSQEAITLSHRKQITDELFYLITQSEGYENVLADFRYHAQEEYPTIPDLILWARYHGNPLNTREKVWEKFDVNERDYEVWEWLQLQRITTQQIHTLFRRGIISDNDLVNELQKIGWRDEGIEQVIQSEWTIPNAMLLLQGDLQQGLDDEAIIKDISKADIHPDYAQTYLVLFRL